MREIKLKLKSASSRILVGSGASADLVRLLAREGLVGSHLVVSQDTVLSAINTQTLGRIPVATIANGERAKTLRTVERLLDRMLELKMTRQSTVIAIGGGVVGDVAGFAASLFLRGIPVVQVPTTLLAQVDSSVGGKTAVNHRVGKNLIGTFHQPRLVIADPLLLATLTNRDYQSGLYETFKYSVIRDRPLLGIFERQQARIAKRDPDILEALVYRSLRIKARIVAADEKEGDLRRILNFGHTIGHAIEAAAGYRRVRHGEAVGYGMIGATRISEKLGMIDPIEAKRIIDGVLSIGRLPRIKDLSVPAMIKAMGHDKKVRDGKLHFVLPERIGSVRIQPDVPLKVVQSVLRELTR
jgi:3-dehydroquinate synthase